MSLEGISKRIVVEAIARPPADEPEREPASEPPPKPEPVAAR